LGKDNETAPAWRSMEINGAGGLKVGDKTLKLELVAEDDQGRPEGRHARWQKVS